MFVDVTTVTNGGCISKCASAAANKDECAYDCENGIAGSVSRPYTV